MKKINLESKIDLEKEYNNIIMFLSKKWLLDKDFLLFLKEQYELFQIEYKEEFEFLNLLELTSEDFVFNKLKKSKNLNNNDLLNFINSNLKKKNNNFTQTKPKKFEELLKHHKSNIDEYRLIENYKFTELKKDSKEFQGHLFPGASRNFCLEVSPENIVFDYEETNSEVVSSLLYYILNQLLHCIKHNNAIIMSEEYNKKELVQE